MIVSKYLKWLYEQDETNESIFPIDSPHTSKKPLRVAYPINENSDVDTKRIMIDFDRTIHKYSLGWNDGTVYDKMISGSKECIDELRKNGYEVIIFTARLSESSHGKEEVENQRKMIEEWLDENNIEVDGITSEKLPAEVYIDDRGFKFNGIWNKEFIIEVENQINNYGY